MLGVFRGPVSSLIDTVCQQGNASRKGKMAMIRIHVFPQMEESRARQVVRDLRDCGLWEVTLLTNCQINFKKSICTLTLFLGHRHIMTLKQTLSKVRWIGKASSHSRAQSSLGVNLIFKRIRPHLIPQMESHGFRSHHISIPNPKCQKILAKQDQSCFCKVHVKTGTQNILSRISVCI